MNDPDSSLEEPLDSTASGEAACRICLEPGGEMLQPCDCSGSAANVHKDCLVKWLKISKRTSCEICLFEYLIVEKQPEKECVGFFSDDFEVEKMVIFTGFCCFIPICPLAYYIGLTVIDIYFTANVIWVISTLAVIQRVRILPTLTFWKFCLTVSCMIVSFQSQHWDLIIFDCGLLIVFILTTFACLCKNSDINR